MKYLIIIAMFSSLIGCFGVEPETTGLEGKALPGFKLLSLDSSYLINTNDIPSGQPIMFFYFSPNCPYCKSQMEMLIKASDDLKGIKCYAISAWPLSEIKKFSSTYDLSKSPNIILTQDTQRSFVNYFHPEGVPFLAVYGKDKRLKEVFLGKISPRQLRKTAFN